MTNAAPAPPPALIRVLLGLTFVAGLVDAVSVLALGHVFTANMTGNVVFLAFAVAGAPGLSLARSGVALVAFLIGALGGGRLAGVLRVGTLNRWLSIVFGLEALLLFISAAALQWGGGAADTPLPVASYAAIILTALAMGGRNATVRQLAVPDLTTTVLTLTLTGLAADSPWAGGTGRGTSRRIVAVVVMFGGAAVGAWLVHYAAAAPLALGGIIATACTIVAARLRPAGQRESV
jgi:uncharacterized membrane protein YoaK (UPF0700 family)